VTTAIFVRYPDMDGLVELQLRDDVCCENCGSEGVQGVNEPMSGIGQCHPCFYAALAQGVCRVVRAS
jgi:ribosomal protein L37AE/L43A